MTSASLLALKTKRGRTELFADTQTSRGRMAIVRAASLVGGRRALRLNDALTSGRLAGPAPISGAAKFAAAPDGARTWRGGLTIDFPGLAAFPWPARNTKSMPAAAPTPSFSSSCCSPRHH